MGTGIGHFIPLVGYIGFWVMCLVALSGRPVLGLYYVLPFLPYRSMRDRLADYPLGTNLLTLLVLAVIAGALIKRKRLPPSGIYMTWLLFALYLYLSMWVGVAISDAPAPLWLSDINFVTWKDYMVLPLLLVAAGLSLEDRQQIRRVIFVSALSLLLVDKSALAESLSHSWVDFDESTRTAGPLVFGSNQLGAFLAQFGAFFFGLSTLLPRISLKLLGYGLVFLTSITTLYTFSRGAYLALLVSIAVLAVLKNRKLILVLGVFLLLWQSVVPTAVQQRISMTKSQDGHLEASAEERVDLWKQSEDMFLSSPILGRGYATFQFGEHTASLKDTHNWYVKVLVETGIIGGIFAMVLIGQMLRSGFRLFRRADDPLYKGLGLGFLLATVSCMVANFFGDRWTYVEINGILWVLQGAVLRAYTLCGDAVPQTQPAASAFPFEALPQIAQPS